MRFDEEKIYVGGESWGTILGVLAVLRQPELFHEYIGSGQMVDVRENSIAACTARCSHTPSEPMTRCSWRLKKDALDRARRLMTYLFANGYVMSYYEKLAGEYSLPQYVEDRYDEDPYGPWGVLGSEYTLVEKVNVLRSLIDYFSVMYPQIQDVDLRRDATRLDVPVYLVQGPHELMGERRSYRSGCAGSTHPAGASTGSSAPATLRRWKSSGASTGS